MTARAAVIVSPDAVCTPPVNTRETCTPASQRAAVRADQRDERVGELRAAAARDRHAALLHRDRDHLRHVAGRGGVGPETRVQHPGREQAVRAFRDERRLEPVARRDEQAARELRGARATEPPHGLRTQRRAVPRPELGAEHTEREVGVREELREQCVPGSAVAGVVPVELGGVRLGGAEQEGALAVRVQRRRRQLGVQVLEPVRGERVAELRVRRRRRPRAGARR